MNAKSPRQPPLIQRMFSRQTPKSQPDSNVLHPCSNCYVCGGSRASSAKVVWQEMIADWRISPEETAYINCQRATTPCGCHKSLRTVALAKPILAKNGFPGTLRELFESSEGKSLRVPSINTAGGLSATLGALASCKLAEYPEHDMTNLGLADDSFGLVTHSDTLEHAPISVLGIQECKRLLVDGESWIFTIQIIVGKLSADRTSIKMSHHGSSGNPSDDWAVQTEYAADAWMDGFEAGLSNVKFHYLKYPAAVVSECGKSN